MHFKGLSLHRNCTRPSSSGSLQARTGSLIFGISKNSLRASLYCQFGGIGCVWKNWQRRSLLFWFMNNSNQNILLNIYFCAPQNKEIIWFFKSTWGWISDEKTECCLIEPSKVTTKSKWKNQTYITTENQRQSQFLFFANLACKISFWTSTFLLTCSITPSIVWCCLISFSARLGPRPPILSQ